MNEIKKTSKEWQELKPDVIVYDPDGWDRENFEYSWNEELITENEYFHRLSQSTCLRPTSKPMNLLTELQDLCKESKKPQYLDLGLNQVLTVIRRAAKNGEYEVEFIGNGVLSPDIVSFLEKEGLKCHLNDKGTGVNKVSWHDRRTR